MLNKIKEVLDELKNDKEVPMVGTAYGLLPISDPKKMPVWNYFVFERLKTSPSEQSRKDFTDYYVVHIIHEDAIPEGYIAKVLSNLLKIKGLRKSSDDITYEYTKKGGSDMVVEIADIVLYNAKKQVVI